MIARFHEKMLLELLQAFPVVAVIGPRQVGKSTMVTSSAIGEGRDYLSLDDISLRRAPCGGIRPQGISWPFG